jgi:chromosome segregation ATPase
MESENAAELEALQWELSVYEAEIQSLTWQIRNNEQMIADADEAITKHGAANSAGQSQYEQLMTHQVSLDEDFRTLQLLHRKLEFPLELSKSIAEVKQKMSTSETEIRSKRTQIAKMKERSAALIDAIANIASESKRLDQIEAKLESKKQKLKFQLSDSTQLREELESLQELRTQKTQRIESLQFELREKSDAISQLERSESKRKAQIQELRSERGRLQNSIIS